VNAFTIAATALLAGFLPCGWVVVRARWPIDALVGLEVCGVLATLVFLCLAQGFNTSSYFNLPVISAVSTWIGGLVYARFLGRRL
jgi:multisubunit Na+/H+ antiporter MnhF subunit